MAAKDGASPVIVWFRRDLRLADNQALLAAAATGRPVLACYIHDPDRRRAAGAASRWWLYRSLQALTESVASLGGRVLLRRGDTGTTLAKLAEEAGAREVFTTALPTPDGARQEAEVGAALGDDDMSVTFAPGALLFGPDPVRTQVGEPYRVFTPFSRACLALDDPGSPQAVPKSLAFAKSGLRGDELEDWDLLPAAPNWAKGFERRWQPGEAGAHARIDAFLEKHLGCYPEQRDRPDLAGTSALSPHLAFGELSPRQAWAAAKILAAQRGKARTGADAWLRQLIWREFSYYLLHHWPTFPDEPFRAEFAKFPWADDPVVLACWQTGSTGYPIVDAGMRELWETGWMHNRVRMIVASFLVKDLLVPWQRGEAWFWDTLVDADPANNPVSWQWVAGSGADAAPYFRIFNPITQGEKFDPNGDYVRRYLPELSKLPIKYLHSPWKAPEEVLTAAGLVLGRDYPQPIVDHAEARKRALKAYRALKDDGG